MELVSAAIRRRKGQIAIADAREEPREVRKSPGDEMRDFPFPLNTAMNGEHGGGKDHAALHFEELWPDDEIGDAHPVSFLRGDLRRKGIATCAEAMQARDGRWVRAAGLVLVRQTPSSGKGVMFITIEDETGDVYIDIGLLRRRQEVADRHVLDHPLAKRACRSHRGLLS